MRYRFGRTVRSAAAVGLAVRSVRPPQTDPFGRRYRFGRAIHSAANLFCLRALDTPYRDAPTVAMATKSGRLRSRLSELAPRTRSVVSTTPRGAVRIAARAAIPPVWRIVNDRIVNRQRA